MTNDPTTDGVIPDQLARLLKMVKSNQADQSEKPDTTEISESLYALLASHLSIQDNLTQSLSGIMQQVYKELTPLTEQPLEQLLLDPTTNVFIIRHIKTCTKEKAKSAVASADREAARVVYYMAIAHALAYHDECITSLSYSSLMESFQELTLNDWLQTDIIDLFKKAIIKCSRRIRPEEAKQ